MNDTFLRLASQQAVRQPQECAARKPRHFASSCETFRAASTAPDADAAIDRLRHASANKTRAHLAIATLYSGNRAYECALPLWCQGGTRLADALAVAGRRAELLMLTPFAAAASRECERAVQITPLSTPGVVSGYSRALERYLRSLAHAKRAALGLSDTGWLQRRFRQANLLKICLLALEDQFELILFSDLDVYLAETPFDVAAWLRSTSALLNSTKLFVGSPDHSAPVNGGFWLMRPRCVMFREAVRLLTRGAWSWEMGYSEAGRPSSLVSGRLLRSLAAGTGGTQAHVSAVLNNTLYMRRNAWSFVGGASDQGLLWHLFYVSRPYGTWSRVERNRTVRRSLWSGMHFWGRAGSAGRLAPYSRHSVKPWSSSGHDVYWRLLELSANTNAGFLTPCRRFAGQSTATNKSLRGRHRAAPLTPRKRCNGPLPSVASLRAYTEEEGAAERSLAQAHLDGWPGYTRTGREVACAPAATAHVGRDPRLPRMVKASKVGQIVASHSR